MKYQFEGFAEGDRVRVTRPEGHYDAGVTYEGVLTFYIESEEEEAVQIELQFDNGEEYELLESGPGAWDVFAIASIEKVEA